jgi:cysteinyl-tRNA synthetase
MKAVETLGKLKAADKSTADVSELARRCADAMADDLNSPMVISALFDWVRIINQAAEGQQSFTAEDLEALKSTVNSYVFDILGLRNEKAAEVGGKDMVSPLVDMLLNMRLEAKRNKDWGTSDKIRNALTELGFTIKDTKDGFEWSL